MQRAVVLSWHVDYWDYLGWKDPFGSPAYSQRQTRYAKALALKQRWTPMLLVDNRPVRGRKQIDAAVKKAHEKKARVGAKITVALMDGKVEAKLNLRWLTEKTGTLGKNVVVQPVLYVREASTKCTAGECKGRTLKEYFAVVAAPKPLAPTDAFAKGATVTWPAPKGVKANNLGVAFLLEDSVSMKTIGCWWVAVGK